MPFDPASLKDRLNEYQIDDALSIVDDVIYKIDDKIFCVIKDNTSIGKARDLLYESFSEMRKILEAFYPDSKLIDKYNLREE